MSADLQARLATAASFILQSPPGEVNDVFNDVRAIVGDDDALESGILPALEKYNVEQLIVAALPDKQQLLICQAGAVQSPSSAASKPQRFIDPSTGKAWIFDHLRLSASDPLDVHIDAECETFRVALEKEAREYAREHFGSDGVSKVFTTGQRQLKRPAPSPAALADTAPPAESEAQAVPPPSADTDALVDEKARMDAEGPTLEETPAKVDIDNAAAENVGPVKGEPAVAIESTSEGQEKQEEKDPLTGEAGDSEMQSAAATPAPEDDEEHAPVEDAKMDAAAAEDSVQPAAPLQEQEETVEPVEKRFSLYFVGNKYNPANYWTGRWRSSYTLDLTTSTPSLTGEVQLNVHFFEQGNVQLATTHTPSISLSVTSSATPAEIARSAIKAISKAEEEYQLELNEAYREMAEKTFRSLRRALPVTKQKMRWEQVANYKLGRDIGGAQR